MMASLPIVTTIVPTYRRPRLLARAIRSVLNQTYPSVRVLVLDDASGDETGLVVRRMQEEDPRIEYHVHPQNQGPDLNWIFGVDQIETPFFSFLSDDDFLLPEFYKTAIKKLDEHPEAMFFCGTTCFVNNKGQVLSRSGADWDEGLYTQPSGFVRMISDPPSQNGILFRSEVIQEIDYSTPVTSFDSNFLLQAALHFPFWVNPRIACAAFQVHGNNTWNYSDVDKAYSDALFTMAQVLYLTPHEMRPEIINALIHRNYGALKAVYWRKLRDGVLDEAIATSQTMQERNRYKREADMLNRIARFSKRFAFIRRLFQNYPIWRNSLPFPKKETDQELLDYLQKLESYWNDAK